MGLGRTRHVGESILACAKSQQRRERFRVVRPKCKITIPSDKGRFLQQGPRALVLFPAPFPICQSPYKSHLFFHISCTKRFFPRKKSRTTKIAISYFPFFFGCFFFFSRIAFRLLCNESMSSDSSRISSNDSFSVFISENLGLGFLHSKLCSERKG